MLRPRGLRWPDKSTGSTTRQIEEGVGGVDPRKRPCVGPGRKYRAVWELRYYGNSAWCTFAVTLHRDCDYGSELSVSPAFVGDLEDDRCKRISEALNKKCPKLMAARNELIARSNEKCISVLILESDDPSLANYQFVAEATVAELAGRNDVPDLVVWARTSSSRWRGWFIKDGLKLYPDPELRTRFDLGSADPGM